MKLGLLHDNRTTTIMGRAQVQMLKLAKLKSLSTPTSLNKTRLGLKIILPLTPHFHVYAVAFLANRVAPCTCVYSSIFKTHVLDDEHCAKMVCVSTATRPWFCPRHLHCWSVKKKYDCATYRPLHKNATLFIPH